MKLEILVIHILKIHLPPGEKTRQWHYSMSLVCVFLAGRGLSYWLMESRISQPIAWISLSCSSIPDLTQTGRVCYSQLLWLCYSVQEPAAAEPPRFRGWGSSSARGSCGALEKRRRPPLFGSSWLSHPSRAQGVLQPSRGAVQHQKVVVKELSREGSQAGRGRSVCTRGETRISISCPVRVSHRCSDR